MYIYIYMCVYIYICICIYTYIYIHMILYCLMYILLPCICLHRCCIRTACLCKTLFLFSIKRLQAATVSLAAHAGENRQGPPFSERWRQ